MRSDDVNFWVYFRSRFDRQYKCTYVGGDIGLFDESYDLDCLSFFEVEKIVNLKNWMMGWCLYRLMMMSLEWLNAF
jgi:hypothetical protein